MEQTHDRSGQPDKHEIALRAALKYIVRSRHGLQNSKITTFRCEAIAECQRSRVGSENREPPESTWSSTRPITESVV